MAKTICRPRPQATVFLLMARRLVEKTQARPNMVSRPRMPVNRPIFIPCYESVFRCMNHAMHQRLLVRRRSARNLITLFQQRFCARALRIGVAMNGAQRLALCDFVAYLFMNHDADGGIDGIFLALAPSAEDNAGGSDVFAGDRRHISRLWTGHVDAVLSTG